jgi:ABC-type Fe3+ transport system substrate-binding protein
MNRRFFAVSLAVAMLIGFAGVASAAEKSPELQALIKAAQAEKTLNLSWAPASIGGPRGTARATTEINKMFGININIEFTPGGMMPAMAAQITRELSSGQPAFTDVFLGAASFMRDLVFKYDVFQAAPFPKYLPGRITDEVSEQGGRAVKLVTSLSGVSYNKSIVPGTPKTLADLLTPGWKGKIGSTPYAAGFDQLAAAIGNDATIDFATKLSSQMSGLMRCNEPQRIASGEFGALVFDCNPHYIDKAKAAGAPVDFAFIKEFNTIDFFYLGVPKNAEHPNLAKLYITYIQTLEGQQLLWDTWQTNLHVYPETQVHADVEKMKAATGGKVTEIDMAWHDAHRDLGDLTDKVSKILTSHVQ